MAAPFSYGLDTLMAVMLGTASASITLNSSGFTSGVNDAIGSLGQLDAATELSNRKTQAIGAGLLGVSGAITGVFAYGATQAISFGEAMANTNSIIQVSSEELENLSQDVLDLASASGQAPTTLANGLYDIASSGFAGAEGLMVLEAAAYAATAGMTTTEVSAKGITAVLNAYGLEATEAERISNIMFATVDKGVITFEELSANMGNTLPLANALGISFEELGAGYALMTKSGIGASQAETQIAALMRSAISPTQELTAAVIEFTDYSSVESLIAAEGLTGYLALLTEASGGTTEGLFNLLGTAEATNAALVLGGENADEYAENLDYMRRSSEGLGATQTALAKQMESTAFSLRLMKTNIQAAAIALGVQLEPAIRKIAQVMTIGVKAFLNLSKPIQQVIGAVAGLIAVVAGAAGAWIVFGSTIALIGSILGTIALPILAVTAALAGLYFAWETNFLGIRDITADVADSIMGALEPVVDFFGRLKDAWDNSVPTGAAGGWTDQVENLGGTIMREMNLAERAINALDIATGGLVTRLRDMGAVQAAISIGSWAISAVGDLGSAVYDWVTDTAIPGVSSFIAEIPEVLVSVGRWAMQAGANLYNEVKPWVEAALGAASGIVHQIPEVAVSVGAWIMRAGANLYDVLRPWIEAAVGAASGIVHSIPEVAVSVGAWVMQAGANLYDVVGPWIDAALGAVSGIPQFIESVAVSIGDWFVQDAPSLWADVTEFVGLAWSTVSGGVVPLIEAVNTKIDNFVVEVSTSEFWAAVTSSFSDLWNVSDSTFASVKDRAGELGNDLGRKVIGWIFEGFSGGGAGGDVGGPGGGDGGAQNLDTTALAAVTAFAGEFIDGVMTELTARITEKTGSLNPLEINLADLVFNFIWPDMPDVESQMPGWLYDLLFGMNPVDWVKKYAMGSGDAGSVDVSMPDVAADWNKVGGATLMQGYLAQAVAFYALRDALKEVGNTAATTSSLITSLATPVAGLGDAARGVGNDLKAAFSGSIDVSSITSGLAAAKAEMAGMGEAARGVADGMKSAFASLDTNLFSGLADAKARLAETITVTVDNSAALAAVAAVTDAIANIGGGLKGGGASVSITADTTAAVLGISVVRGLMSAIDGMASTVILLGNSSAAVLAITTVRGLMTAINGMTSTIFIKGDNSQALRAIREVQAYAGRSLGTATFTVNTITTSSPVAVGQGIGSGVLKGWDQSTGTRSPSTEMIKRGQYLFQGLDIGWTGSANNLPVGFNVAPMPKPEYGANVANRSSSAYGSGGVVNNTPINVSINVEGNIASEDEFGDRVSTRLLSAIEQRAQQRNIALGLT